MGKVVAVASCFKKVGATYVVASGARVRIAGVDLTPTSGQLTLDPRNLRVQDTVEVRFGNVLVYRGALDWKLTSKLTLGRQKNNARIGGMAVSAGFSVQIVSATAAKVSATATLPKQFGGISGDLAFTLSLEHGLELDAASIAVPSVTLGVASLRDASLRYESTGQGPKVDRCGHAGAAGVQHRWPHGVAER